MPETVADGQRWPKISIVTPSFNQDLFIEETIRSVLLQGYPNLEYLIIDGGSTDGSREIIRKYAKWLFFWVSEKDRGQANAINKGFERASGQVVAWINSDDLYQPNTLNWAATAILRNPDAAFVYGNCYFIDNVGAILHLATSHTTSLDEMLLGNVIAQPTVFYRTRILRSIGFLKEEFKYVMDFDLWLRILRHHRAVHDSFVAACFRLQSGSKSVSQEHASWDEMISLLESQLESNVHPAQVRKAIGLACMMAGWAYVYDAAQHQIAAEYFSRAKDLGLFGPKNLPLAAKRSQSFIDLKRRLDASTVTVERLRELQAELGLPQSFWNWLSALDEIGKAEVCFKEQQLGQLRVQIARALGHAPSLIFDKSVWPFILCAVLGHRWLQAATSVKHRFGLIFRHAREMESTVA